MAGQRGTLGKPLSLTRSGRGLPSSGTCSADLGTPRRSVLRSFALGTGCDLDREDLRSWQRAPAWARRGARVPSLATRVTLPRALGTLEGPGQGRFTPVERCERGSRMEGTGPLGPVPFCLLFVSAPFHRLGTSLQGSCVSLKWRQEIPPARQPPIRLSS